MKYDPLTATLNDEIAEYRSDKNFDPLSTDCLEFWRLHHEKYPILSQIARRLLCYQATSVPSERLFSAAGYMVWDRRASLHPEKVNKIMVINQYQMKRTEKNKN